MIGNAITQGIGVATGLQDQFSWMNVAAVVRAFDGFMAGLGRPERAYLFEFGRGENDEHGAFVAAHGELFPQVAAELGLPLRGDF